MKLYAIVVTCCLCSCEFSVAIDSRLFVSTNVYDLVDIKNGDSLSKVKVNRTSGSSLVLFHSKGIRTVLVTDISDESMRAILLSTNPKSNEIIPDVTNTVYVKKSELEPKPKQVRSVSAGYTVLNVAIAATATQVKIINKENQTVWGVKIMLNPGLFNSGYYYEQEFIKTREVLTVGLLHFANKKGSRFDPLGQRVRKVEVRAKRADGSHALFVELF